ncbi:unnamed protein product [Triticum turgidum subsp. durum]|uniref:Copine C-terminal domain-containing protein n=1 Tax=Triticum turgidum subsp. durum TaxID=4567 RepID=A0A9R0ZJZ7_TRITD|nr:unnamed protein product [Triticum turgidum subsp. durum]
MEKKAPKPSYNSAYGYGNSSTGSNSRYATAPPGLSPWYASSAGNNVQQPEAQATLQRKYSRIGDDYRTVTQVTEALAQAGLESSNLIVGIDFTKRKNSYNRRCLHDIGRTPNPYEQAISIIGRTLSDFDEDNLIPCFGFGDASTHDKDVFSFYPEDRPCTGFEEALERYRQIVPALRLSGPTSFAPIIETAIGIVDSTGGQYHVLLIIADGQVTRNVDTQSGQLSQQEWDTINAIVKASQFPLSIVLVGVGDGPWDMMHKFDDNIPARSFDNFQFVNFTEIMSKSIAADRKEAEFALSALMEIPTQYKATLDLQLLGYSRQYCHLTTFFDSSSVSVVAKDYLQEFLCLHQQRLLLHGLLALTNRLVFIHGLVSLANKQVGFSNQTVSNSDSMQLQGGLTVIHQKVQKAHLYVSFRVYTVFPQFHTQI